LNGGPLDGQILPLDDAETDRLVLPYSETQLVYLRSGDPSHTGADDGPTEVAFRFAEKEDDLVDDGGYDEDQKDR
jgi:hypothetical protein